MNEALNEHVKEAGEPSKKSDPLLFEQYKVMVATTSEVTKNRQTTNSFYLTLDTFLLGAVNTLQNIPRYGILLLCITGMVISFFWYVNIGSYRNLNRAKFIVVHEMEKNLPVKMFKSEEEAYQSHRHISFTTIERCIPAAFIVLYAAVIAYKVLYTSP